MQKKVVLLLCCDYVVVAMKNFPTVLRVVTYEEDGEICAHALELDLVGVGDSEEEAIKDLEGAVETHLRYCARRKLSPYHRAPQKYFDIWEKEQDLTLSQSFDRSVLWGRAGVMPLQDRVFFKNDTLIPA